MKNLSRLLYSLLFLLLAVGAFAQNRAPFPLSPPAVPASLGVNIHFTDPQPGEIEQLAGAGFQWVRMDFAWEGIERTKGVYDFAAYDRLMNTLRTHGNLHALFILDYGNDLYGSGSPRTPEARAAFARFAAAAVTHFRSQNQSILWEMWNEPNGSFWKPTANVDEYIALALETGQAIRKAVPEAWYIGPGTSGMDFPFFEKCFRAGLLRYWDAVSFHPYRNSAPETAAPDFQHLREMIAQYAPRAKEIPLISSEWGYSELYDTLSLAKQTEYSVRENLSNMLNGLRLSIWYDWHDDGADPKEIEHHFGTVFNDYKPKPTYQAIQTLAKTLDGFHYNKRLSLDSPDDYCLLFANDRGEARLAVWTTSAEPHRVVLPARRGMADLVGLTGTRSQVMATAEGLPITLSGAVQYLIPQGEVQKGYRNALAWNSLPPYLSTGDATVLQKQLAGLTRGTWKAGEYPVGARLTLAVPGARVGSLAQSTYAFQSAFQSAFQTESGTGKPTHPLSIPMNLAWRGATPTRMQVTLTEPGTGITFSQETLLVPRHPLLITVETVQGKTLPVEIANPSGEPLRCRVGLSYALRDGEPLTAAPEQMAVFAQGETRKRVAFDLKAAPSGSYRAGVTISERTKAGTDWQRTMATPTQRYTPLEDFAGFNQDAPLPADTYTLEPDGDPKVKSESVGTIVAAPERLEPKGDLPKTLRIAYTFGSGWKFLRVAPQNKKREALPGRPTALGMWIYGDGSGDILRMRFTDSTGQTFQAGATPDERIEWKGWHYLTFPLNGQQAGHWGGTNDGIIHYPIHLDSLLLIDSPTQQQHSGILYVTGVTLSTPE